MLKSLYMFNGETLRIPKWQDKPIKLKNWLRYSKKCKNSNFEKFQFLLENCVFLNENCYFSKFYYLHFLLYLGQFLSHIDPFYHFGILKVSSLRICILISIMIIMKKIWIENKCVIFFPKTLYSTLTTWPHEPMAYHCNMCKQSLDCLIKVIFM